MGDFYVYFHRRKTDNKVFYVGKGKDKRAFSTKGRTKFWKEIVKEHGFKTDIVEMSLSSDLANEREVFHINNIGLSNLCNITIGGVGGDTISNHPNRDVIIKSMGNFGEKNPNFKGKSCTKEWSSKQSKSQSKITIQIVDTITGTIETFINSKDAAISINCSASGVRAAKSQGYLIFKRYKVKNL